MGLYHDPGAGGNAYIYVSCGPVDSVDPLGLQDIIYHNFCKDAELDHVEEWLNYSGECGYCTCKWTQECADSDAVLTGRFWSDPYPWPDPDAPQEGETAIENCCDEDCQTICEEVVASIPALGCRQAGNNHVGGAHESEGPIEFALGLGAGALRRLAGLAALARTAASGAGEACAAEGIYWFMGRSGRYYVGQSGDIPRRIAEHLASGKLAPGTSVCTRQILGGRIAREVAEQLKINEMGGIGNLENIRNVIGPAREHLLNGLR